MAVLPSWVREAYKMAISGLTLVSPVPCTLIVLYPQHCDGEVVCVEDNRMIQDKTKPMNSLFIFISICRIKNIYWDQ